MKLYVTRISDGGKTLWASATKLVTFDGATTRAVEGLLKRNEGAEFEVGQELDCPIDLEIQSFDADIADANGELRTTSFPWWVAVS